MNSQPRPTPRPMPTRRAPGNAGGLDAFRKVRQEMAADDRAWYSEEGKERLFNQCVILYLHGARKSEGRFGPKWEIDFSEESAENERHCWMSLASNLYRDKFFDSILPILASGPIGPVALSKIVTKSGQESWEIIPWDELDQPS